MKSQKNEKRKSFEYNFNKKRSTKVAFDVEYVNGKKTATNIELISNWRAHNPQNPIIALSPKGEYGFQTDGFWMSNGDIQQMIKRINRVLEEY